jgi:A/G-specific adenine glycosylase
MMLQQTTVATVTKKFQEFIQLFPSWASLAAADQSTVMLAWRGLGYYRRARRLHAVAQLAQNENNFIKLLLTDHKMPGIGSYTTNALLAIGLNQPALALDANLRRVLSRYLGSHCSDRDLTIFYEEHLSHLEPRGLNEALMDLGRVVCSAKKALCSLCPLSEGCLTKGLLHTINNATQEKKTIALARIIVVDRERILGYKKQEKKWLEGYIEVPTFIIDDFDFAQYQGIPQSLLPLEPNFTMKSSITHYRVLNHIYLVKDISWLKDLFSAQLDYYGLDDLWANTSIKMIGKTMQLDVIKDVVLENM